MDDIRSVQLVVTTRHATTYKKLSEGQQTEKKSGRNQKLQILNIQNMLIFAGSRNKPRHDEENHQNDNALSTDADGHNISSHAFRMHAANANNKSLITRRGLDRDQSQSSRATGKQRENSARWQKNGIRGRLWKKRGWLRGQHL